uniref:Putative c2h2-type zn-finger protein n=1 Tax=Culex tarsalis TaxID=7177 RepID=A0A1Q3F3N7_CULTA
MPVFKLERYPYVCRLCLKPEQHRKMTSLDTEEECFEGGTLEDFLATLTFQVEEEKRHLFPRSLCPHCVNLLRTFAHFRTKVRNVHLLMNALVELRDFNPAPIKDLFQTKPDTVRTMLTELDLCHKADLKVEDLINEFPQFQIAKLAASMGNKNLEEFVDMTVEDVEPQGFEELEKLEDAALFAEECPREELTELTNGIIQEEEFSKNVIEKKVMQQETTREPEARWNCLDDSDEDVKKSTKKTSMAKIKDPTTKTTRTTRKRKRMNWDFLNDSDPEEELTLDKLEDLDAALANRKYGTARVKEPLQCPKCPYKTIFKSNFHSHQLTHLKRENLSYPCKEPGCKKRCSNLRLLQMHKDGKHNGSTFICESCGQQCSTDSKLKEHIKRYHSNASLNCEYCQKTFKLKIDLRSHLRSVHLSESKFKCATCGMEYRRKSTLNIHEATHSDVYNYPCQQCDKKFKVKSLLNKHIMRVHKEATLECEHCFKMFYTRWMLLDHIESVHEIQMRFVCDICVATLDSQEDLAVHKARHENPKNLECGLCLKVFLDKEQISDHVCITYREDYVCCGRDWRQHLHYNKHMLVNHGVKLNARVKPEPNVLLGQVRAKRKRVESCSKCEAIFPTRTLKKQHQEMCLAGEIKT